MDTIRRKGIRNTNTIPHTHRKPPVSPLATRCVHPPLPLPGSPPARPARPYLEAQDLLVDVDAEDAPQRTRVVVKDELAHRLAAPAGADLLLLLRDAALRVVDQVGQVGAPRDRLAPHPVLAPARVHEADHPQSELLLQLLLPRVPHLLVRRARDVRLRLEKRRDALALSRRRRGRRGGVLAHGIREGGGGNGDG